MKCFEYVVNPLCFLVDQPHFSFHSKYYNRFVYFYSFTTARGLFPKSQHVVLLGARLTSCIQLPSAGLLAIPIQKRSDLI